MSIQPKRKECKSCKRSRYIFSRGRCAECAAKEDYKPLKRTPIKRNGKPIKKTSKNRQAVRDKDTATYNQVWAERPHYCEECVEIYGKGFRSFLGAVWQPFMFSHILTKGAHPVLRHEKENFNLLCLEHHQMWEFGKREEMHIYPRNQRTIQNLLELERNGK